MERAFRRPGSLMRRLRTEAALCSRWETNQTRPGVALLLRPRPPCRKQEANRSFRVGKELKVIDPRMQMRSRRRLLSLGCTGGLMNLLGMPGIAQTSESKSNPALIPEVKSVVSFGARGDGSTDDTAAFHRALDSVHKAAGGTVYAPPGRYLFRGTLDVPEGVSLRGSYLCVP